MAVPEPPESEHSQPGAQPGLRLDLLTKVAHDVRTPLASLQGYLELLLLRQGELDAVEARNYLHTAVRQSERLSHLVNQLFEWSRLEAGETRAKPEDFVLAELLHDVKQRFEPQAQRRNVTLSVSDGQAAQATLAAPAMVRADIALVERALGALLDNALRHTAAGGQVSLAQEIRAHEAHVEVSDSGSGMDALAIARVFAHDERGARSVDAGAGAGDGDGDGRRGLGLAIVRRIAQLHGSELTIHSQPQQGTRVGFALPLATGPARAGAPQPASRLPRAEMPLSADLGELRSRLARSDAERDAERSAAQAAQRALEQRYGLAVRGAMDGLWEWHLDSDAVLLSPRWKSMLGFDDDALQGNKQAWLARIHAEDRNAHARALQAHLADPDSRLEMTLRMLHRDGSVRYVLSRAMALRDDEGRPYRMLGMDSDVTALRRVQTILDAVAEGSAGAFGADFFAALVHHFARALELDCAFITECVDQPPTKLRTLAFWSRDKGLGDNFEYMLAGTPCDAVVNERRDCFIAQGLASRFPREQGFEAYLGLPIFASDGQVLGHLAFLNAEPRGDDMLVPTVYRIFLARAAAEIERLRALAQLKALRQSMLSPAGPG
jgi:PAS domain S-box-containing protein